MAELMIFLAKIGLVGSLSALAMPYVVKHDDIRVRLYLAGVFAVGILFSTFLAVETMSAIAMWFRHNRDVLVAIFDITFIVVGVLAWTYLENRVKFVSNYQTEKEMS